MALHSPISGLGYEVGSSLHISKLILESMTAASLAGVFVGFGRAMISDLISEGDPFRLNCFEASPWPSVDL